jgi:hypothetical protein
MAESKKFKFRNVYKIGYPGAEQDQAFLESCFIDSGQLAILRDTTKPECIVLGRTGSGKSALLEQLLSSEGDAFRFLPETLSLKYVSNSTILRFLYEIGVDFDLFFKLLWKHVFAVELIRRHYGIDGELKQANIFQQLLSKFNAPQQRALDYLRQYGDRFWIESDDRVVEIVQHFENEIQAKLGFKDVLQLVGSIETLGKEGEKQRHELKERAQKIVNEVQVSQLTKVVSLHEARRLTRRFIFPASEKWETSIGISFYDHVCAKLR